MKTKLLLALWLCFGLSLTSAFAEEPEKDLIIQDTIIFLPDSNVKVLFIGDAMKEMTSCQRIDSVKMMLISDVEKAQARAGYPVAAKTTHYFISTEGKRRLKAESEEYLEQGVDVEKESRSLQLGLLPYAYFIHDLVSGYEIQIYLSDPSQLKLLKNYNLSAAISTIAADKKMKRNSFKTELERRDNEWILKSTKRRRNDLLEITPNFGFGLFGNQWSPAVGLDLRLTLTNKYGLPSYRFGFGLVGYTFTHDNSLDFSNVNFLQSYNLTLMANLSAYDTKYTKAKWFGVSGGLLNTTDDSGLDKRYKAGIVAEGFVPFSFSFDIIFLKEKKSVYGMTMTIPF
jgi:hypothetical protein